MGKKPMAGLGRSLLGFQPNMGWYPALDNARTQLRECLCRSQLAQPPEYEKAEAWKKALLVRICI